MDPSAQVVLKNSVAGSIIGPVLTGRGYELYKLVDRVKSNETFAKASHILIRFGDNKEAALAEANKIYDRIIKGEDFAAVAKVVSQDPSNAPNGGDLGWFGKNQMVKEFEAAVFNGKIGVVQKPIETQFGFHIVKVTDKMTDKFVIEKISNKIEASATTIDKIFNDAGDFAYLADKNSFEEEAKTLNYEIKESIPFLETTGVVPGLGSNKALMKFAFENNVGAISEVYKVNAGYVVASVAEEMPAGYKTFEEVKPQIENLVKNEKKLAKSFELAAQVKSNLGNNANLEEAAAAYTYAKYNTATDFTRSSSVPGAGKDFALTDFAFETELNKVAGPVKGQRASYLVKVTYRTELKAGAYESQRGGFRDNLLAQKNQHILVNGCRT